MSLIASYLKPELVFDLERADSPVELFAFVAEKLTKFGVEPATAISALAQREEAGSTGIGHGVALPHAIIPGNLSAPLFAFIRVRKGVNWHAIDSQPVKLICLIVAQENQRPEYLKLLAEISHIVAQPHLRQKLLKARDVPDLIKLLLQEPTPGFFAQYKNAFILVGAIIVTYIISRFLFPALTLPATGIYEKLGYTRFNYEPWLTREALTAAIFLGMILGTIFFWRYRVALAATSIALLLLMKVMDIESAVEYMSIPTVIFIMAMMALIKWLENIGVFRTVVARVAQHVGNSPALMLIVLMLFSIVLSGFAGEVSGILVTFGLALEIARRTKSSPLPYLLALVFATNVGSALTLVGNPIGVYIAFAGGLTFENFLRWATPVSLIAGIVTIVLCLLLFRHRLSKPKESISSAFTVEADPAEVRFGIFVFIAVILLIVLHARIETWLHLGEGTMLIAAPLAALAFVLFTEQERGKILIERGVDWWTILFFMFLFANAACLEHTGVTTKLGYLILKVAEKLPITHWLGSSGLTGSSLILMLWFSGISSGFVDNMPIVAALVPIVKTLVQIGLPHASILWWSLLLGGCYGGNLTMIGSSANLVAVGAYEKATGQSLKFAEWIATGAIVTLITLVIATILLLSQISLSP
ncbi:PTS transporter subunit EIIA [candidate division WOR-3 bacterium]|nr:PTS transporter subunit EIIA [candidate division WOR-3 bacterium]